MPEETIVTTPDTPAGDPPASTFDWNAPLPDNLPPQLKSLGGKTWQDLVQSHASLRQRLTEATAPKPETPTKPEAPAKPDPQKQTSPEGPKPLGVDEFRSALASFYESGKIDGVFADTVSERGIAVPADELADYFEFKRNQRDTTFQTVAQTIEGATPETVADMMAWAASDESPFDQDQLRAFDTLASMGDNSWAKHIAEAHARWIADGGGRAAPAKNFRTGHVPARRPNGPTTDAGGGFSDGEDFGKAFAAARARGDKAEMRRIAAIRDRQNGVRSN